MSGRGRKRDEQNEKTELESELEVEDLEATGGDTDDVRGGILWAEGYEAKPKSSGPG